MKRPSSQIERLSRDSVEPCWVGKWLMKNLLETGLDGLKNVANSGQMALLICSFL